MLVPHPDINSLIIHNYLTANSLINVCFTSKHNLYKFLDKQIWCNAFKQSQLPSYVPPPYCY
jgi:hypothetical protein